MRYLLFLLAAGCYGQTCTPLSFPAIIVQGQTFQPAIVNGIDQVTTNSVRFQYTSNSTSNAVLIVYATAAQWTANGNKIIAGTAGTNYSSFQGTYPINNTPAGSIFGNNITNLAANTTYYIAGLASSNGGSTWCPEVDESFTTHPGRPSRNRQRLKPSRSLNRPSTLTTRLARRRAMLGLLLMHNS